MEDYTRLSKEELLTRFLFSRDTLVRIRLELLKDKTDKEFQRLFEITQEEFEDLKKEIYRRMERWVKV